MSTPSALLSYKQAHAREWTIIHQLTGVTVVSCPSEEAAARTLVELCTAELDWAFTVLPPSDELSQQILLTVQKLEKQHLVCRGQSKSIARAITSASVDQQLRSEFTSAQRNAWIPFSSHSFEQEHLKITLRLRHTAWVLTLVEDIWHVYPLDGIASISHIPRMHLAEFFAQRLEGQTVRTGFDHPVIL